MDKPKQKRNVSETSSELLAVTRYEFVSPIPFQECVSRFRSEIRQSFWSARTVDFARKEDDTYEFRVGWGLQTKVISLGYLKKMDETSTQVIGEAGIDAETIFVFLFLGVAALVLLGIGIFQGNLELGVLGGGLMGAVGWLIWLGLTSSRDTLVSEIKNTLNANAQGG